MSDLPQSRGERTEQAPVRLVLADAVHLENIECDPRFGAAVAISVGDPARGQYLMEFELETAAGNYELWIEYAAGERRPTDIALDGQKWLTGTKNVTGGWHEGSQVWHYEATAAFTAGTHRLSFGPLNYLPHIRAVALLPVSEIVHEPRPVPRQPERTLVCILAQTRAHALTWASFKRNVLDELNADLAVAVGVDEHYDYANPFWQHAQHRWAAREYEDFGAGFDEAQQWLASEAGIAPPRWQRTLDVGGNWLGGMRNPNRRPGAGGALLYFRWFLRHHIVQNGLLDRYDRFIITRSDFVWTSPHPPLSVLDPKAVWVPNGEFYGGVPDRHMIVSRADLPDALGLLDDILLRPDELAAQLEERNELNFESYLLFHLQSRGLASRTRVFPYVMFTVRSDSDPTSWSVGEWNEHVGARIKYPSEYQATQVWSERLRSRRDWEQLMEEEPNQFPPKW
jgi:hypothetical protein